MEIELTFRFPDNGSAAAFLERINDSDWPSEVKASRPTGSGASANRTGGAAGGSASVSAERAPWEEDEPESDSGGSSDPWAEDATPARTKTASVHPDAGKLFPASGEYDKDTPNGNRHWEFGVTGAPECDCGYPAARVTGRKAGAKRDWQAYWCPIKFTKNYRDACKFSEFV